MEWKKISSDEELDEMIILSAEKPCLVFKHSIRCSLSSMMLSRFNKGLNQLDEFEIYMLDIINHRSISNRIADQFGVRHESPQILLIQDGKCIYNASHSYISADSLTELIKS